MSSPIRVGFVGLSATGWASTRLAPSLLQPSLQNKYKIVAVSTTSEASSTASAKKHSEQLGYTVKAYHGDTTHIASDTDVDLVVVSIKTPYHKPAVLPVIAQKKNFFLEWPAGRGLQETLEIAEAAHKQGVKSIVGLQARNSPVIKKVRMSRFSKILACLRCTYQPDKRVGPIGRDWRCAIDNDGKLGLVKEVEFVLIACTDLPSPSRVRLLGTCLRGRECLCLR